MPDVNQQVFRNGLTGTVKAVDGRRVLVQWHNGQPTRWEFAVELHW